MDRRRTTRYEALAEEIARLIQGGVLRPGERLPSTRALAASHRASAATVMQAYALLEDRGAIRARPRSGYYVSPHWRAVAAVPPPPAASGAAAVEISDLVFEVLGQVRKREVVPFGSAFPSPFLFPLEKLAVSLGRAARRLDPWKTLEDISPGSAELRRQIAKRYAARGIAVHAETIVVTSGAMEGLNLCLGSVTRPGDVVAIESPAFYAALQAIERLGLRAVEVRTDPREGVDLAALETAVRTQGVKACWLMPTLQNPLGATMPEAKKRDLVRLLERHDVPLIEDDVYGELHFGAQAPLPAKAFDRKGLVLHCGSFSKSLAPGYRIGWCAPGRYAQAVERAKLMTSIATSIPVQEGVADYLRQGGYDRHLRSLRATFQAGQGALLRAIAEHFPPGTHAARPEGGYLTWVTLPVEIDAMRLHRQAVAQGISLAPGPIFSPSRRFGNCIRLNHGYPWTPRLEAAVAKLGKLAAR